MKGLFSSKRQKDKKLFPTSFFKKATALAVATSLLVSSIPNMVKETYADTSGGGALVGNPFIPGGSSDSDFQFSQTPVIRVSAVVETKEDWAAGYDTKAPEIVTYGEIFGNSNVYYPSWYAEKNTSFSYNGDIYYVENAPNIRFTNEGGMIGVLWELFMGSSVSYMGNYPSVVGDLRQIPFTGTIRHEFIDKLSGHGVSNSSIYTLFGVDYTGQTSLDEVKNDNTVEYLSLSYLEREDIVSRPILVKQLALTGAYLATYFKEKYPVDAYGGWDGKNHDLSWEELIGIFTGNNPKEYQFNICIENMYGTNLGGTNQHGLGSTLRFWILPRTLYDAVSGHAMNPLYMTTRDAWNAYTSSGLGTGGVTYRLSGSIGDFITNSSILTNRPTRLLIQHLYQSTSASGGKARQLAYARKQILDDDEKETRTWDYQTGWSESRGSYPALNDAAKGIWNLNVITSSTPPPIDVFIELGDGIHQLYSEPVNITTYINTPVEADQHIDWQQDDASITNILKTFKSAYESAILDSDKAESNFVFSNIYYNTKKTGVHDGEYTKIDYSEYEPDDYEGDLPEVTDGSLTYTVPFDGSGAGEVSILIGELGVKRDWEEIVEELTEILANLPEHWEVGNTLNEAGFPSPGTYLWTYESVAELHWLPQGFSIDYDSIDDITIQDLQIIDLGLSDAKTKIIVAEPPPEPQPIPLYHWYNQPVAFAEVKDSTYSGDRSTEEWEVMNGVPTTQTLYINAGGTPAMLDIYAQQIPFSWDRVYAGQAAQSCVCPPDVEPCGGWDDFGSEVVTHSGSYWNITSIRARAAEDAILEHIEIFLDETYRIPINGEVKISASVQKYEPEHGTGKSTNFGVDGEQGSPVSQDEEYWDRRADPEVDPSDLTITGKVDEFDNALVYKFWNVVTGTCIAPAPVSDAIDLSKEEDEGSTVYVQNDKVSITIENRTYEVISEFYKEGDVDTATNFESRTSDFKPLFGGWGLTDHIEPIGYLGLPEAGEYRNNGGAGDELRWYVDNVEVPLYQVNGIYNFDKFQGEDINILTYGSTMTLASGKIFNYAQINVIDPEGEYYTYPSVIPREDPITLQYTDFRTFDGNDGSDGSVYPEIDFSMNHNVGIYGDVRSPGSYEPNYREYGAPYHYSDTTYKGPNPVVFHNPISTQEVWIHDIPDSVLQDQRIDKEDKENIITHDSAEDEYAPSRQYLDFDFDITFTNDGSFNTSYFSTPTSSTKGILNVAEIGSENHYGQNPVEYNDTGVLGGENDSWGFQGAFNTHKDTLPRSDTYTLYNDVMNTDLWINAKYVKFDNVNVRWLEGGDADGEYYVAGTWIKLYDDEFEPKTGDPTEFSFHITSNTQDVEETTYHYLTEAINIPKKYKDIEDVQARANTLVSDSIDLADVAEYGESLRFVNSQRYDAGYISYNNAEGNVATTTLLDNVTTSAKHATYNTTISDVIGRIGNVVVDDSNDPRWGTTFWNPSSTPYIANLINYPDTSVAVSKFFSLEYALFEETTTSNPKYVNRWSGLFQYHDATQSGSGESSTGYLGKLPVTRGSNLNQYMERQVVKLGYDVQFSVQTLGTYDTEMTVLPTYAIGGSGFNGNETADFSFYAKSSSGTDVGLTEYYNSVADPFSYNPTYNYTVAHTLKSSRAKIDEYEKLTSEYISADAATLIKLGQPHFIIIPQQLRTHIGGITTVGHVDSGGGDTDYRDGAPTLAYDTYTNSQRWHARLSLPTTTQVLLHDVQDEKIGKVIDTFTLVDKGEDQLIGIYTTFRANQGGSPSWDLTTKTNTTTTTYPDDEFEVPDRDPDDPRRTTITFKDPEGGSKINEKKRKPRIPIIVFDYSDDASTDSKVIGTH